ncbi:MAG: hypothetical protein ACP5FU_06315 [Nitrososphaeria archaeon]
MKIAITYGKDHVLRPLDEAEIVGIYDSDKSVVEEYENPGYMRSKEFAMLYILKEKPDAIIVKQGFLCPGSYAMSRGKLKYIITDKGMVEELLEEIDNPSTVSELDEEIYAENEFE